MAGPADEQPPRPSERVSEAEPADGEPSPSAARVEEKYDFDDFGPEQLAEMSAEEWEAAFDASTWITGPALLDRVQRDLEARIADRDVFAVLDRDLRPRPRANEASDAAPGPDSAAGEQRLVAYSDEGYALVYEDGSVEGRGTVLRDVKPSVALCSMDDYEVPDAPASAVLPAPGAVVRGSGDLGNKVLQAVGVAQILAGLVLLAAWLVASLTVVAVVVAFGFVVFGVVLLFVVANARLSDRFRADEYRARLRDAGVEDGERPAFVPASDEGWPDDLHVPVGDANDSPADPVETDREPRA